MADVNVTVIGYAGNDPVLKESRSGLTWTQFRVGSTRRWLDTETGKWVDGATMWFTVKAWGNRAANVAESIRRGTPVVVVGRLNVEPYTVTKSNDNGEPVIESKNSLQVENATVAVDLSRGVARYVRTDRGTPEPSDAPRRSRSDFPPTPFADRDEARAGHEAAGHDAEDLGAGDPGGEDDDAGFPGGPFFASDTATTIDDGFGADSVMALAAA